MLTLQAQHPPAISPYFPSSSPSPTPSTPPLALMSDPPPVTGRPRRSSRHLLNPNMNTNPSSSSSLYAPFPNFHLGDGSRSTSPIPAAPSGSRLRFGESWLQAGRLDEEVDHIPPSLLIPSLPKGRFIQTWRLAPKTLARVIGFLHGSYEVLTFCHLSKEMNRLVSSLFEENDAVRDAFLSRTIRGYEPSTSWLNKRISIDLPDMALLLESESVSLAAYPTHALRVITSYNSHSSNSLSVNNEIENTTSLFQTLTLAHSRFVAYLRHRTAPQAMQLASQDEDDALVSTPDSDGSPELIFPSPLFYFNDIEPPVTPAYLPLPVSSTSSSGTHSRPSSKHGSDSLKISKSKSAGSIHGKDVDDAQSVTSKSRMKRLSLKPKRKSGVPPPPPSSMAPLPTAYNATMPATNSGSLFGADQFGALGSIPDQAMSASVGHGRSRSQSYAIQSSTSRLTLPPSLSQTSFGGFTPPSSGQWTPPSAHSRNTPPSTYGRNTPPPSTYGRNTPPPTGYGGSSPPSIANRRRSRQSQVIPEGVAYPGQLGPSHSMPFLSTPGTITPASSGPVTAPTGYDATASQSSHGDIHSLSQVFRLSRAPIFRVFVPCSQLNPSILKLCIAQLHAAALLPHLRAGDLICNLGYVPDTKDDGSNNEGDSVESRGWMVFSGHDVQPLTTRNPIPVRDPTFVLNVPHYYSHILAPGENPRFELVIPLAPKDRSPPPAFSLVRANSNLTTLIKKSDGGGESLKKHKISRFIWLARVECARWGNEWLIEAEGTKEGRQFIEHALEDARNGIEREWELVREKTGRGKVYIRKL